MEADLNTGQALLSTVERFIQGGSLVCIPDSRDPAQCILGPVPIEGSDTTRLLRCSFPDDDSGVSSVCTGILGRQRGGGFVLETGSKQVALGVIEYIYPRQSDPAYLAYRMFQLAGYVV